MTLHGLILAGGHGSRLGMIRKGEIRIGGRTLEARVSDILRRAGAEVMVSVSRTSAKQGKSDRLPDLDLPLGGPMAGIVSAAQRLERSGQDDLLVTVAVDTPFLPEDFVRRLVAALDGGAVAALAAWDGNPYPTNAIWRISALRDLPRLARDGTAPKGPKALLAGLGGDVVDWADTEPLDPFVNLNTLDDLVALARRGRMKGF